MTDLHPPRLYRCPEKAACGKSLYLHLSILGFTPFPHHLFIVALRTLNAAAASFTDENSRSPTTTALAFFRPTAIATSAFFIGFSVDIRTRWLSDFMTFFAEYSARRSSVHQSDVPPAPPTLMLQKHSPACFRVSIISRSYEKAASSSGNSFSILLVHSCDLIYSSNKAPGRPLCGARGRGFLQF